MLLKILPALHELLSRGGMPFLAGGFVRDRLLGVASKDIDVEVHKMPFEEVLEVLKRHGEPQEVGKAFGVIKMRIGGSEFDFSVPRREKKTGSGHKGFEIKTEAGIGVYEACERRDFTCNAMLLDPFTNKMIDLFGGFEDLRKGTLKHVSDETFGEDPLRALRAFQFAARFDMVLAPATARIIRGMVREGRMTELPVERVWGEWAKWAVKSTFPSAGLLALLDTGLVDLYPELSVLLTTEQNPETNPEGSVWDHTCHAVDEALRISRRENLSVRERTILMFAALCHDLGKAATFARTPEGKITAYGHDKAGVEPARAFLGRIGAPGWVVENVLPLVENHMAFRFREGFTLRTCRRLALKVLPSSLIMLSYLMEADGSARPPKPREEPFPELLEMAERLKIMDEAPKPILMGRHLIGLGMKPGPEIGEMIKRSFEAQLDGTFEDELGAIEWAINQLNPVVREICDACGAEMPTEEECERGSADGNRVVCWGGSPCDIGHSCK